MVGCSIARPGLIKAIANCNGILTLAPNSLGPAIGAQLLQDGTVERLSAEVVRPFYKERSQVALRLMQEELTSAMGDDHPVLVHKPEGCIFLWVWFRDRERDNPQAARRLPVMERSSLRGCLWCLVMTCDVYK